MAASNPKYYTYIKPIFRNKVVRNYSSITFTLFTTAIFSIYALRPTIITILSLQKTIEEQTQTLQEIQKKRNDLALGKDNYQKIDTKTKDKINELVPQEPSVPKLITILNKLSEQSSASISGIQIQPFTLTQKPKSPTYSELTPVSIDITFSILGSYNSILEFLSNIKKSGRVITINSLNFSRQENGLILMTVNASAAYLKK